MADAGDVIENPATGQRLTFLATAGDTSGEFFRAEGVLDADRGHRLLQELKGGGTMFVRSEQDAPRAREIFTGTLR